MMVNKLIPVDKAEVSLVTDIGLKLHYIDTQNRWYAVHPADEKEFIAGKGNWKELWEQAAEKYSCRGK